MNESGLLILAGMVLLTLLVCSRKQIGCWEDSVALFSHALTVNSNSILAEYNLGQGLQERGDRPQAVVHYLRALELRPTRLEVEKNFQSAARINLGILRAEEGKWAEAEALFRTAMQERPGAWHVRSDLADALASLSRLDEAVAEYRIALRVAPDSAEVWRRLGVTLMRQNKSAEALAAYREAVKCNPNGPLELNELAWFLATDEHQELRDGAEAIRLAQRACELTGRQEPRCLGTLDAAYAEAGLWNDAISTAQTAHDLALAQGRMDIATAAAERLDLYRSGKPCRVGPASSRSP